MNDDPDPMRVGIIGLTPVGFGIAELFSQLGQEVTGADAKRGSRDQFEREFETPTYETPEELLDQDIDAAVVTPPNKFHEGAAVKALKRDLPVLIEKPLAHTLESARRIRDAATDSESFGMTTFNHKFLNRSRVLKSYIDDGYFGDLSHIHARHMSRRDIPSRGSWMTSRDIAGGGVLYDRGTFVVDMLLYFMDYAALETVSGRTWREFDSFEEYAYLDMYGEEETGEISDVEDSAIATLRFENGCSATIEVAWAANIERDREHSYEIRGENAGAHLDISYADDPGNTLRFYEARKGAADHFLDIDLRTAHAQSRITLLDSFLDHVRAGTNPTRNTLEQAVQIQKIITEIGDATVDHSANS